MQNTDPCVFGNSFVYFNCKQHKKKRNSSKERIGTGLSKLEKGSLILFGSTKIKAKNGPFFQLDTVFVVSDYICYNMENIDEAIKNIKSKGVSKDYIDAVFKMAFPKSEKYSLELRFYFGATYKNQIEGMYSFSPSKIYQNESSGFERIKLRNSNIPFLTNNINSSPKLREKTLEEIKKIWKKVRQISRKQGYVEGVKFRFPPKQ